MFFIRLPCNILDSRVNPDATWRNMALMDPPATDIEVHLFWGSKASSESSALASKRITDNAGMTLGRAIDAVFSDAGQIFYYGPERDKRWGFNRAIFDTIDEPLREFEQVAGGTAFIESFLIFICYRHAAG